MDKKFIKTKLAAAIGLTTLTMTLADPANAVVVVGGENGWEISFEGSVSGFYVNQDPDDEPSIGTLVIGEEGNIVSISGGVAPETLVTAGRFPDKDEEGSRVRSGLLPTFFSFNVKSPTVYGLTGKGRVSFAPVIQTDRNKNNGVFIDGEGQLGSSIDMREAFFNLEGNFGTLSVGRALSLFQRQNYLLDMSLFGAGVGGDAGGQFTLGHSGFGYLYPNYNARFAYKTPDIYGFNIEVGMFDPSGIDGLSAPAADQTEIPRFEGEASYATTFTEGGTFKAFVSGLWQEADFDSDTAQALTILAGRQRDDVTAWGAAGGISIGYAGLELIFSGYTGEALGSTLMLDQDALDPTGEEREHHGWLAQGTYLFPNRQTKIGLSYGQSMADETNFERTLRVTGFDGIPGNGDEVAFLDEQTAWTVGVYHDVTDWFKVVAEYTNAEREWFNGQDQDNDIFAIGGFFSW